MTEFDFEVDASGLNCPLPLLRLKKILQEMACGEVVKIIATDPAAHLDFGVFTEKSGHEILDYHQEGDIYLFYIRKA